MALQPSLRIISGRSQLVFWDQVPTEVDLACPNEKDVDRL